MTTKDRLFFSMDYVYTPKNVSKFGDLDLLDGIYKNVHVDFNVVGDRLHVEVSAVEPIETVDLEDILTYIQQSRLRKSKINIMDDCDVLLKVGGQDFRVVFDRQVIKIGELRQTV